MADTNRTKVNDGLSPDDELKLNVLLAGNVLAVRIDEGARALYALTEKGEARVNLNPLGRADRYFIHVRELLGRHAMNLPSGYPVHLMRWTRMGQSSPKKLEQLLNLGENEAIQAVAHAPTLTDELARRAWWALPTMEVARVMLSRPAILEGQMGKQLAQFLAEHLPFEQDQVAAMHTVRALVASRLLEAPELEQLWRKAQRRPHYLIGFLESMPNQLPNMATERAKVVNLQGDSPATRLLQHCFSAAGQAYIATAILVLEKPQTHEAVALLLDMLGAYFQAGQYLEAESQLAAWPNEAKALAALSQLKASVAEPILIRTTAVGPLLRRHLEPLFAPILADLQILRAQSP